MAGIEIAADGRGKKALDVSIPLVPFIDLLLCCVMFLLVTAVWNELASIDGAQRTPGSATANEVEVNELQFMVLIGEQGYVLASTAGDRIEIPRLGADLDRAGLHERLQLFRSAHPNERAITVAPDDGIPYAAVIATMDTVRASGFSTISL